MKKPILYFSVIIGLVIALVLLVSLDQEGIFAVIDMSNSNLAKKTIAKIYLSGELPKLILFMSGLFSFIILFFDKYISKFLPKLKRIDIVPLIMWQTLSSIVLAEITQFLILNIKF